MYRKPLPYLAYNQLKDLSVANFVVDGTKKGNRIHDFPVNSLSNPVSTLQKVRLPVFRR